jgi:hypothetical protein
MFSKYSRDELSSPNCVRSSESVFCTFSAYWTGRI